MLGLGFLNVDLRKDIKNLYFDNSTVIFLIANGGFAAEKKGNGRMIYFL
jgi:hypothetical protein